MIWDLEEKGRSGKLSQEGEEVTGKEGRIGRVESPQEHIVLLSFFHTHVSSVLASLSLAVHRYKISCNFWVLCIIHFSHFRVYLYHHGFPHYSLECTN